MPNEACKFHQVFAREVEVINSRRDQFSRTRIELEKEDGDDDTPILRPKPTSNVVGLALSGGGVRSAAFCLGALQALEAANRDPQRPAENYINKIDYLSTVSGGGYIGASMTAAMSATKTAQFPFPSELRQNESPALQHIRDHSNYLFPGGIVYVFYNVVIYLRGIVASLIQILCVLLACASITIWCKPTTDALSKPTFGPWPMPEWTPQGPFAVTLSLSAAFVAVLAIWALWRSRGHRGTASEITSRWQWILAGLLSFVIISALCEVQPIVLAGIFQLEHWTGDGYARVASILNWIAGVFGAVGAVVGVLSRGLASVLKRGQEQPGPRALIKRALARLLIYIAALAVPLLLWVAYLYLTFMGILDKIAVPPVYHAPLWITAPALWFGITATPVYAYMLAFVVLLLMTLMLAPNANSLHRLYRDRISQAFLVDPMHREDGSPVSAPGPRGTHGPADNAQSSTPDSGGKDECTAASARFLDLAPLDHFRLSDLDCTHAPYHLLNAALNVESSKYANRRGRNADFFLFSPEFVGSAATDYVKTETIQRIVNELDLATAVAISGAAASSNMGRNTIGPLALTLTTLNIRLGFWLTNPMKIARHRTSVGNLRQKFYFFSEAFSQMREDSDMVYLTDGGHIENLGIYELLRRRCRLIIAVDAEADPDLSFNSFVALQRFARIDLGVRIDLPWAAIRDVNRAAHEQIAKTGGEPPTITPKGPHCALGKINYPMGGTGYLLYVKSSLSGDEDDYIVDYCRRYPDFPHETTADQFFTEEQFEVYRALGFHAVYGAFTGDTVAMRSAPPGWLKEVL